jgi:hypothetical protein
MIKRTDRSIPMQKLDKSACIFILKAVLISQLTLAVQTGSAVTHSEICVHAM